MNLDMPSILSGLFIGLVGMFLFVRGKREADLKCLGTGLALCIFPYFISSLVLTWGVFALCMGGLYYFGRNDTSGF